MNRSAANPHAAHDEFLLARFFGDDLGGRERRRAEDLIASCEDCAALVEDLRAIAAATATLPTPNRPRDFALTEADAARLRRRSPAASLFGWLGRTRALGTSLTAIGMAGFLALGAVTAMSSTAPTAADRPQNPEFSNGGVAAAPTAAPAAAQSQGYDVSVTDQSAGPEATRLPSNLSPETPRPPTATPLAGTTGGLMTAGPATTGTQPPHDSPGPTGVGVAYASPASSTDGRTSGEGTGKSAGAGSSPLADHQTDGSAGPATGWPDGRSIAMGAFAALALLGILVIFAVPALAGATIRRRR
jgi:hypothetical protein